MSVWDKLNKNDLITDKYLNKLRAVHPEWNYDQFTFNYREDLTYQSDNVKSIPEDTSASVVYEVLPTFMIDKLSGCMGVVDFEHHEIHEGDHFFYSTVFSLANGATAIYTLKTGAKPIHFVFSIEGNDAGISGNTYENVTANEDGTLITINNNNRNSVNTTTTTIRFNPTGLNTTDSVLLRSFRAGAGGTPSTRSAGSISRGNELIFKPNTKYSLSITNLSTSTNNISFDTSWYEEV